MVEINSWDELVIEQNVDESTMLSTFKNLATKGFVSNEQKGVQYYHIKGILIPDVCGNKIVYKFRPG